MAQQASASDAATEALQVDDLEVDWLDYGGIAEVFENAEEDLMHPCKQSVPRATASQTSLSLPLPLGAGPLPPIEPDVPIFPREQPEPCDYELIRQSNIDEFRSQWYENYGREYPHTRDSDSD